MFSDPILKLGELYGARFLQGARCESADPVVRAIDRLCDLAMPADLAYDSFPRVLYSFFDGHGVDIKVVTCYYNSTLGRR